MIKYFSRLNKVIIVSIVIIFTGTNSFANNAYFGSWENITTGDRIDILDGFKTGVGPVLSIKNDGSVSTNKWENSNGEFSLTLGYDGYTASLDPSGNLLLSPSYGDPILMSPVGESEEKTTINLKDDEVGFLEALGTYKWLTSLDGNSAIFKSTFSPDSGVVELTKDDKLDDLLSFGIASGVIKIGSEVIIEARINDQYFIGINERDDFIVFKSLEKAPVVVSTVLAQQRKEFFDKLLTGEWQTTSYGSLNTHKFRPVYGELAGELLTTRNDRLYEDSKWEYSPSTGAIKIGYTDFVGAVIVNDTLALIEKDGDQKFFIRAFNSSEKRYTLADVKASALNENSLQKISEMLSAQFQRGEFFYSFEFKSDGRSGFSHKWSSSPFNITGETFSSDMIGKSDKLFQIEDFIIFDGNEVYKMDATPSRLRAKSEDEVKQDAINQEQLQVAAQSSTVTIRLMTVDGEIKDVPLPVSSFGEIASISILSD
jgi:hypothetical protein